MHSERARTGAGSLRFHIDVVAPSGRRPVVLDGPLGSLGVPRHRTASSLTLPPDARLSPAFRQWIGSGGCEPHDLAVVVHDAAGAVVARWGLRRAEVATAAAGAPLTLLCEWIDVLSRDEQAPVHTAPAFERRRRPRSVRFGTAA